MKFFQRREEHNKPMKRTEHVWDKMFSYVDEDEVSHAKQMTFRCLSFADDVLANKIVCSMTTGQRAATIAYAKVFHYGHVDASHIVHALFYAYLFEALVDHIKIPEEDAMFTIGLVKKSEATFLERYYFAEKGMRMYDVTEWYYRTMKSIKTEDAATHINMEFGEFQDAVRPLLKHIYDNFLE